jgi:hypothetical protein
MQYRIELFKYNALVRTSKRDKEDLREKKYKEGDIMHYVVELLQ